MNEISYIRYEKPFKMYYLLNYRKFRLKERRFCIGNKATYTFNASKNAIYEYHPQIIDVYFPIIITTESYK